MADAPFPVDGIAPPPASPATKKDNSAPDAVQKRAKSMLLMVLAGPYVLYVLWCFFLMTILPSPTGDLLWLQQAGTMSAIIGAVAIGGIGFIGLMRIGKASELSEKVRKLSLIRIAVFVAPGLLVSAAVPFVISREPPLQLTIKDPVNTADFVAPLSVTFSLDDAIAILGKKNLRPTAFSWDLNSDGVKDDDTVVPEITTFYDRQGTYTVSAKMTLNDGSTRTITRRISIPRAVFSINPTRPIVDQPIQFDVSHLVEDPKLLREVRWDFDQDGNADEVTKNLSTVFTYYKVGEVKVSASILLENQTQTLYERTFQVSLPDPLPFPIRVVSEPVNLISPAPFGTIFRVETEEPLGEVAWDFGDRTQATGDRVGHTFEDIGNFLVTATVRSQSGDIVKLTKLVRVVETLRIGDLAFDGTPTVTNGKISEEVPVSLDLTPRTALPLIEFLWEAPDATVLESTGSTLKAIYRKPGTYIITLVAQDPDSRAMRMPITLEVKPPSSFVSIKMTPEGGVAPLRVRLDASETVIPGKEISGFEWMYGVAENEKPQPGGAQIEYLYEKPGTFTVQLVAKTTDGGSYETSKTIVIRPAVLDACFFSSRTTGTAPMGVTFDLDCTTGNAATVLWDFGDGAQSDERSPVHVFEKAGVYTVKLTIKDTSGGESTETATITVTE